MFWATIADSKTAASWEEENWKTQPQPAPGRAPTGWVLGCLLICTSPAPISARLQDLITRQHEWGLFREYADAN